MPITYVNLGVGSQTFANSLDAREGSYTYDAGSVAHPDYRYYKDDWIMIRDALAGERQVKEKGVLYLPPLDKDLYGSGPAYRAYKMRANFVNMTSRTLAGLLTTIFRRPLKVTGTKKAEIGPVSLEGDSLDLFAKKLAYEIISMGRVGVLVDMPPEGQEGDPYFCEYVAENILSWKTRVVGDRKVPVYVLLREILDETPTIEDGPTRFMNTNTLRARYRVLSLDDDGVYRQRVYNYLGDSASETIVPTRNGQPLDFIPMLMMGPSAVSWEVQRSPILDIVNLNFSHYRTSAQLEHGRYFTAQPTYYVFVDAVSGGATEYQLGPSNVWEIPKGNGDPGILEYSGNGLVSLERSLTEKESHISQLSGRIMGNTTSDAPQNSDVYRLSQANELAILTNVTDTMSAGLTQLLKWRMNWMRMDSEDVEVKVNQDFKTAHVAARELRALALLYEEGLLPIEQVFTVLQNSYFIDEDMTLEEFKASLEDADNFPNNPDILAKQEGYPDAAAKLKAEEEEKKREAEEERFEQGQRTQQFETANAPPPKAEFSTPFGRAIPVRSSN